MKAEKCWTYRNVNRTRIQDERGIPQTKAGRYPVNFYVYMKAMARAEVIAVPCIMCCGHNMIFMGKCLRAEQAAWGHNIV